MSILDNVVTRCSPREQGSESARWPGILGNEFASGGYSYGRDDLANILNRAVAELPARPAAGGPGVDLIAEPYNADTEGQEQGNFPVGWSEWNDRYRDTFRAAQNKLGIKRAATCSHFARLALITEAYSLGLSLGSRP
jgi:glycogen operon protein